MARPLARLSARPLGMGAAVGETGGFDFLVTVRCEKKSKNRDQREQHPLRVDPSKGTKGNYEQTQVREQKTTTSCQRRPRTC